MAVSKVVKSNGDVIMDISQDNVNPNNLLQGGTAHGSDGEAVQGAVIVAPTDVTEVSDTTPYIYKSSEHDAVYDELVGGSVAWNQLIGASWDSLNKTEGTTFTQNSDGTIHISGTGSGLHFCNSEIEGGLVNGHKYLYSIAGMKAGITSQIYSRTSGSIRYIVTSTTNSIGIFTHTAQASDISQFARFYTDTSYSGTTDLKYILIDLTQMFDPTIADYVYNLEQSTAGSGIAWLKSYGFFTKDYYAYNAGTLTSVNVRGKKVTGKNSLEITTESTTINGVTFTVDKAAGTVTANGTSSSTIWSFILIQNKIYPYDVIISGCPQGGNWTDTYSIQTDSVDGITYYDLGDGVTFPKGKSLLLRIVIRSGYAANNLVFKPMIRRADVTDSTFEPYTSITYPIQSTDLRGLYKLNGTKLYTDGDIYSSDGTVTRKYGYRDYQSGDESLANAITDGTHTIYKLSAPTIETASSYTSPQMVYRNGTEEYLDSRDMPMPVGGNRKYVDIPEWMVNKYFDDVRSSASGAIAGDLVFDESSSAHGHGLVSSDNKKEIVFNHHMITLTSSSGNRVSLSDGDEQGQIILRQGDVEISGYKHSSQGDSQSASVHVYYEAIEVNTGNDGIIITNVMQSGTGVNLVIAPDGTICKASSSRNVKHDISYVEDTKSYHDALMQLKPATFIYNSDKTETQKLGMIAEDVADVCPIAGMTDKDGKVENYDDRAIIAMLVAEVQRLNAEIDKLKGR